MVNTLCVFNETILYKAQVLIFPSPLIDYSVALASLVCLVAMLYDIFVAIRHRKSWLPCSWFPLTSFTVTLVIVATKITNDLTTDMLTRLGQLSKVTGTAMIGVCMGFFMPSLGTVRRSESLSNMASWTVLVIGAIVSIFLQRSSGIIFSYLIDVDDVIIISCLVPMILLLWNCFILVFHEKETAADLNADLLMKTSGSMFKRLKYCYVYGYISNPQLMLCRTPYCTAVSSLTLICSLAAIEAAVHSLFRPEPILSLFMLEPFRSLLVNGYFEVTPEYESSLRMVVVIQILFVVVGCLAVVWRVVTFALEINLGTSYDTLTAEWEHLRLQCSFYHGNYIQVLHSIVTVNVLFWVVFSDLVFWVPAKILTLVLKSMRTFLIYVGWMKDKNTAEVKEVLEDHNFKPTDWILRKAHGDYERWVKLKVKKSVNHLADFLSRYHDPNQEQRFEEKIRSISPPYKVTCLSLAILAKFAASAFPNDTESIVQTLDEVFKIIYFIDEKTFEAKSEYRRRRRFTEIFLVRKCGRNFNSCLGVAGLNVDKFCSKLKENSRFRFVYHEVEVIQQLIESHNPEQVLAYMLRTLLAKLPIAIYEDVTQSQPEEYEERVKVAIKFLCKLKPVKDQIHWEFPHAETAFTSLFDDSDFTDIVKN